MNKIQKISLQISEFKNKKIIIKNNSNFNLICDLKKNFKKDLDSNLQIIVKDNVKAFINQQFFGGENVKYNLEIIFEGKNSELEMCLIYSADKKQNYDFSVKNTFIGENNKGKFIIKGIAKGYSKVKANGIINIKNSAKKTDAHLSEHALILSKFANVRNLPILNIDTNDVKASHSASVTKLNEEDLFYLKSRGLTYKTAEKVLINGFLKK
jgi:Fe-S cluster assembly scaffold protein SufB